MNLAAPTVSRFASFFNQFKRQTTLDQNSALYLKEHKKNIETTLQEIRIY